jgi:hypothetical protein
LVEAEKLNQQRQKGKFIELNFLEYQNVLERVANSTNSYGNNVNTQSDIGWQRECHILTCKLDEEVCGQIYLSSGPQKYRTKAKI